MFSWSALACAIAATYQRTAARGRWFVPWVTIAAVGGLACGGGAAPSPIPWGDFEGRLVAALCKHAVACGDMIDEETCVASTQASP